MEMDEPKGVVRANHPMAPAKEDVYYFEVTIEDAGESSKK